MVTQRKIVFPFQSGAMGVQSADRREHSLSGKFRAARRKIANPQHTPSLALMIVVNRRDKPLKFWLHNSFTNAPKQWLFAQKWGIISEFNLLIRNNSVVESGIC
jgi:hypothetical protein